jgi:hypothetical protein
MGIATSVEPEKEWPTTAATRSPLLRRALRILDNEFDGEPLDGAVVFDGQLDPAGDVDTKGGIVRGHRADVGKLDRLVLFKHRTAPLVGALVGLGAAGQEHGGQDNNQQGSTHCAQRFHLGSSS